MVKQKKAAEVFEGYEPNDPVVTQLAMEMRRGRSLPPGNPFWSERMRAEVLLILQQARPRDLPLATLSPEQDLNSLDGVGEEPSPMPVQGGGRARSPGTAGVRFRTPVRVSWSSSSTRMAERKRSHGGERKPVVEGKKAMGPMPVDPRDGLEEALERRMVQELVEQNHQLQLEVERLRRKEMTSQSSTATSWVEVTAEEAPATPRGCGTSSGVKKCTPGGTRVPAGPPPVDTPEKEEEKMGPLPPLPPFAQFTTEDLDRYEKVEAFDPRRSALGRNGDWIWVPEEEREERVPDGMRHLQERTMSLEDQVRNLQAQVQGRRDSGEGALHSGGQGLGDGRALRGGEPGGDRALQHGRVREDPDGVQGWQEQV